MVNQGSLHSVLLQSIVSHLVTLGCSAARLPQSGSACISSLSACETFDRGRKQRKGRLPFVGDVWYCFSCLWPLSREELVHAKFTQMSACLFIVAYLTLLSFNYGILERFLWRAEAVQNKKTFWVHLFAPTCAVKKKRKKEKQDGLIFFLDLHLAEWSALSRSCYADAIYSGESCLDVNAALCSLPQAKPLCTCRSTGFPPSPVSLMAAYRWSSTVNKVVTAVWASVLLFPGKSLP